MGRTKKWIEKLFMGNNDKEKKPSSEADSLTVYEIFTGRALVGNQAPPPAESLNEKRAWTFRRLPRRVPTIPPVDHAVPESRIEQKKATVVKEAAAVTIQSFFRSYLARKALKALKGLVKMQALVRGYLVRKRTRTALRCIQSLVTAQARAQSQRIRVANESYSSNRIQSSHQERDHGVVDENVKIVEMDVGESRPSTTSSRKSLSSYPQTAQTNHRSSKGASKVSMTNLISSKDLSVKPSALVVDSSPGAQIGLKPPSMVSMSESPSYPQTYHRVFTNHAYSKQERQHYLHPQPLELGSSPRADDYYFKRSQTSPRDEYPFYDNKISLACTEPKKPGRSQSTPWTGAGSTLGRKKAPQARTRPNSNVDPLLAKNSRVGGSSKKMDFGSSPSHAGHTNTVRGYGSSPSSPSNVGRTNSARGYGSSPSRSGHTNTVNGKSHSEYWRY